MGRTAWVALTDITPLNGCIYAVPARFDPDYWTLKDSTELEPQNVRALPTAAGSVVTWSGRTLHFGGRADRSATTPHISISFGASTPLFEDPETRFRCSEPPRSTSFDRSDPDASVVKEKTERCSGGDGDACTVHKTQFRNPSLRVRLGIIAAQLRTYEGRYSTPWWLKALFSSLGV